MGICGERIALPLASTAIGIPVASGPTVALIRGPRRPARGDLVPGQGTPDGPAQLAREELPFAPPARAADVLEVPAAKISADSSPEMIESWDSVHHLNLVLALEQEFNLQFEPEEIDAMKDIQHILEILGSKVA